MIKKLLYLTWILFTDKHISYNWTNLIWYLKKGYTYSDLQYGHRYILDTIKNMCYDLEEIENKIEMNNIDTQSITLHVICDRLYETLKSNKFNKLISNIVIYNSNDWDFLNHRMQKEVKNIINEELNTLLWKLYI